MRRPAAAGPTLPETVIQVFRPELPPAEGVTDLALPQLFQQPIGPEGIRLSERARELLGRPVRLCGYVAQQAPPVPWKVLLAPRPVALHDMEFGLCDDLPATAMRVELPRHLPPVLPPLRQMIAFTGILELDGEEGSDGRSLPLRLVLNAETFKSFPPLSVTNFTRITLTNQTATTATPFAAGPIPAFTQH